MLTLTEEQIDLLTAMNRPATTRVSKGAVMISGRRFSLRDLLALRAAGLVESADVPHRVWGVGRYQLNAKGIGEAQRRNAPIPVAGAAHYDPEEDR